MNSNIFQHKRFEFIYFGLQCRLFFTAAIYGPMSNVKLNAAELGISVHVCELQRRVLVLFLRVLLQQTSRIMRQLRRALLM